MISRDSRSPLWSRFSTRPSEVSPLTRVPSPKSRDVSALGAQGVPSSDAAEPNAAPNVAHRHEASACSVESAAIHSASRQCATRPRRFKSSRPDRRRASETSVFPGLFAFWRRNWLRAGAKFGAKLKT